MPIYLETDSTIDVGPIVDAAGEPAEGATVEASLLRGAEEIWSGSDTLDAEGTASIAVPDTIELVLGEIITERVEITSGTLNDVRENRRRVLRRR